MFLICGEALFDVFVDSGDSAANTGSDGSITLRAIAGGSPFNVSIGLARLGRAVALCTEISDDRLGRRLASVLRQEGVDIGFVRHSQAATPLALIDLDPNGVPNYGFHGLLDMRLHPSDADYAENRDRIHGIHVGSFPIVSPVSSQALLKLVREADKTLISLDPNIRLSVVPDVALWRRQVEAFRRSAHLIKISVEDLAALYGSSSDPEVIAQSWVGGRTSLVVLTRGERGAVLLSHDGSRIETPVIPTKVIDTVGAGDTYQAALLCWLDEAGMASPERLRELSPEQRRSMAAFAGKAAAITCSRRGPDMPRRAELENQST